VRLAGTLGQSCQGAPGLAGDSPGIRRWQRAFRAATSGDHSASLG
jgi:hypothetical protein